jgi:hypothetical protein
VMRFIYAVITVSDTKRYCGRLKANWFIIWLLELGIRLGDPLIP